MGASWALLGASWPLLGNFLGALGRLLVGSGRLLDAFARPTTPRTSILRGLGACRAGFSHTSKAFLACWLLHLACRAQWRNRWWLQGDEIPSSCPGHVVKDMLGSLDPGWIISLCEAILLRRIAILPTVALLLIIAKCLEDAMNGFIADGLLGLFVDGFPWHADSPSFWGGGQQPPLQPHGLVGYCLLVVPSFLTWAAWATCFYRCNNHSFAFTCAFPSCLLVRRFVRSTWNLPHRSRCPGVSDQYVLLYRI